MAQADQPRGSVDGHAEPHETASLLNPRVQVESEHTDRPKRRCCGGGGPPGTNLYGFWVAVCYLINYLVGVGVLEMPYAFYKAGLAYGTFVIFFSGVMMVAAAMWIAETIARSVGLTAVCLSKEFEDSGAAQPRSDDESDNDILISGQARSDGHSVTTETAVHHLRRFLHTPAERARSVTETYLKHLKAERSSDGGVERRVSLSADVTYADLAKKRESSQEAMQVSFELESDENKRAIAHMEHRFFEMNELLDVFGPPWATVVYEASLFLMMLLTLWSYGAVFGTSFANKFPLLNWGEVCDPDHYTTSCLWTFRIFVLIFGAIVIWISMYEFTEMVVFQLILTGARFVLIFLIVGTCIGGLYSEPRTSSSSTTAPYIADYHLWDWKATVTIFAAVTFAQMMTQGIPAVMSPMNEKSRVRQGILVAMAVTNSLYLLVGIVAALYFGKELKSQINLNYQHYNGGITPTPWWAYIIQYFITLFPAIDVLSVSPLMAITVGNSIRAVLIRCSKSLRELDSKGRFVHVASRLLATLPAIVLAFLVYNLGVIIQISFIPSLWVAFVAPAQLQYWSKKKCREFGIDPTTPFTVPVLSGMLFLVFVLTFSTACYVLFFVALGTGTFAV